MKKFAADRTFANADAAKIVEIAPPSDASDLAASSYIPQRGFLLWRLSDAGRRTSGAVPQAADIRNPSQ
jgi:hypothetical protein